MQKSPVEIPGVETACRTESVTETIRMMPTRSIIAFMVAIVSLLGLHAQGATKEDVQKWIQALGHPSFAERESAEKQLWEAGRIAEPLVSVATQSEHPEVRMRSTRIDRRFRLGIFPDTPAHLRRQIEKYSARPESGILSTLIAEGQIMTALRLVRGSKSGHGPYLLNSTNRPKVETFLLEADPQMRKRFFDYLGDLSGMDRQYATYHTLMGTAEKELERLNENKEEKNWRKRYFLYRGLGDFENAKKVAKENTAEAYVRKIEILDGDTERYLKKSIEKYSVGNTQYHCFKLGLAAYQNDEKEVEKQIKELIELAKRDETVAMHAAEAFTTIGRPKLALEVLSGQNLLNSRLSYLLGLDLLVEALQELGIDTTIPYKESLEKLLGGDISSSKRVKLIRLADILRQYDCMESRRFIYQALMEDAVKRKETNTIKALVRDLVVMEQTDLVYNGMQALFKIDPKPAVRMYDDINRIELGSDFTQAILKPIEGGYPDKQCDYISKFLTDKAFRFDEINKLAKQEGLSAGTRLGIAKAYFYLGKLKDSERWTRLAEEAGADRKEIQNLYQRFEKWEDALRMVADRSEITPAFSQAVEIVELLKLAGREKDAEEALQEILPLAALAEENLVKIAQLDGHPHVKVAERLFDPDEYGFVQLMSLKYRIAFDEKRYSDAARYYNFNRHVVLQPTMSYNNPSYYISNAAQYEWLRALGALQENKSEDALERLRRAHAIKPNNALLGEDVYVEFDKKGFHKEVTALYEVSRDRLVERIEYLPESGRLHNELAWMCSLVNRDLDLALKHSQTAVKLHPQSAAYIDTLANVYFAMGNREKAIEISQEAVDLMPLDDELIGQMKKFKNDPLPKDPVSYARQN